MARFHFITKWKFDTPIALVYEIIKDSSKLHDWCPSVYLDVKTTAPGFPNGIGKQVSLYTKGYLPYTLRWNFEVVQIIPNKKLVLDAYGDLEGVGTWAFYETSSGCDVQYDWDIEFKKTGLSLFAFILRPIFAFNHRWAMQKAYESLLLEIKRKQGIRDVPSPAAATFYFAKAS